MKWILLLALASSLQAQQFSNIVISSCQPMTAVVSNGTIFISCGRPSSCPPTNSPGFNIDFDINFSPFGGGNPFIVETYGGYAYSTLCTPIASYRWNFGDGSPEAFSTVFPDGEFVTHIYTNAGDYNVTYIVTDHCGGMACTNKIIRIPLVAARRSLTGLEVQAPPSGMKLMASTNLLDWIQVNPTNKAMFFKYAP